MRINKNSLPFSIFAFSSEGILLFMPPPPPPQISFPQRGTKDIPLEGLAWKTNTSS